MNNSKNINRWFSLLQGIVVAVGCVALAYIPPILSEFGHSTLTVGRVAAVSALFGIVIRPLWGIVNDKFSCARQSVLIGILATTVCFYLLTHAGSYTTSIIFAILIQISFSGMYNVVDSWSIKLRREGYNLNFGLSRSIGSLTFALAGLIFGSISANYGYKSGIYLLVLLYLGMLPAVAVIPNPKPVVSDNDVTFANAVRFLSGKRNYCLMVTALFIVTFGTSCLDNFYPLLIIERGGTERILGIALFVQAVTEVPTMWYYSTIRKKTGIRPAAFMAMAFTFYAVRTLAGGFAQSYITLIIANASQMFSYALFLPSCMDFLDEEIGKKYMSTATVLLFCIGNSIPAALGNYVWGGISFGFGIPIAFRFATTAIIIGAALAYFVSKKTGGVEKNV